ncbi:hypothetical protein GV829_12810 [Sphingomonas lacunae]|uniref:Uncharacterized protein n=1 Tax=Sphingomonas lacunae TaxID=2698828 RepID=A0A6M4AYT0_9SPHN|nr:hypothetical protein [Sphingomonas lacunae]QJQ33209.1 hypothetical protein GV829_12810 [Sphingomonas lacunae]
MTPDERTVVDLVALAAADNRPGFDQLLSDMINDDGREHIYAAACRFIDSCRYC